MNAKRLTLLVATGLVATGCGASAVFGAASRGTANVSAARTDAHTTAASTPAPTSVPSPLPSPATAPPPPPQVIVTAGESGTGTTFPVTLVNTAGTVLASAAVPADARWSVGAGSGGAYWVTGGKLQRVDAGGVITTVATVPTAEAGRVVVSPDGSEWAYATTSQDSAGVVTNRLYRGGSGRAQQLIVQRTADPSHPSADAPAAWQYYPMSWTAHGILIERQPVGGCGCGTPFDMEMTSGYSAFIDPVTGTATPVTASNSCPLSGAGADGTAACFQASPTGASTGIELLKNLQATAQYALSGKNRAGEATFSGSTLAYATVPKDAGGCGGPDWRPLTTLHVMNIQTGDARIVGPTGLAPVAWLNDGTILGTLNVAGAQGISTSSVVVIDPATGHAATILNQSAVVVGVA